MATPDELPPSSPKLQAYEVMEPSGSEDAEALKFTANGAWPEVGEAVKLAVGGVLAAGAAET